MDNNGELNKSDLMKKLNANELKEYLNFVIDTEIQKPISEMDADLISECVDWSLEIEGRRVEIPEEKIKGITKSIIDKHYRPKRKLLNIFTIIAACIAIVLSVQFISMTAFHENLFKDVYDGTQYIIHHFTHHNDSGNVAFIGEKIFERL